MATLVHVLRARKFRRTRVLVSGVAITLGASLLGTLPAQAAPDPTAPTSSTDAKAAWQNSSHLAEIASEQLNGAKEAQVTARSNAKKAAADLTAAKNTVTSTARTATAAGAVVASYQGKLDAFANASFRGAQLSQLSVMLTAKSAEDFLDESTVINRVAQDTQHTLDDAVAAKDAAAKAKTRAEAAAVSASQAKTAADRAATAASAATATAQAKKAELDKAVSTYQALYDKLSAQEKAAAKAAAEKARQESLAAAAAAAAQQQADADAAAKAQDDEESAASALAAAADPEDTDQPAGQASAGAAAQAGAATAPVAAEGGDSAGAIAAAAAKTKIGFAYTYAGDGPDAYDCSGLTTWAWAQAGVSIPRVSYEQANFPQVPLDQLQPGDLVTYYSPVSHVAIYVGGGMVVSAADEALGIVYVPVDRGGPDPTGHRVPRG